MVYQQSTVVGSPSQHLLANHILTWIQRMFHRFIHHRNFTKQVLISFRLYRPYQSTNTQHCLHFVIKLATESIYEYVTFYHQILNFSALNSKLFEVSKTKELPEAMSSVTSFPVGNYKIQLNIHNHQNPSQKPSQIGKSHFDGAPYP